MKNFINLFLVILLVGFSIWLYTYDGTSRPGALHNVHQFITECEICHIPWRGVTDKKCLQCHHFDRFQEKVSQVKDIPALENCTQCNKIINVKQLKPRIRFHESEKNCLQCHTEHKGQTADISSVDHTQFNPELSCTQCHFDTHGRKFGSDCRECHGITTWDIKGFVHPSDSRKDCNRCHQAPMSHRKENEFWQMIQTKHDPVFDKRSKPSVRECWRCHTTHRWGHLLMEHE